MQMSESATNPMPWDPFPDAPGPHAIPVGDTAYYRNGKIWKGVVEKYGRAGDGTVYAFLRVSDDDAPLLYYDTLPHDLYPSRAALEGSLS
jgi:hypothetical protein